jgi:hypothetical protein
LHTGACEIAQLLAELVENAAFPVLAMDFGKADRLWEPKGLLHDSSRKERCHNVGLKKETLLKRECWYVHIQWLVNGVVDRVE